jgi:SAM-dependent methyltransferase
LDLRDLQRHWHRFGQRDPLWAIISWDEKKGNQWNRDEFFKLGVEEITSLMAHIERLVPALLRRRALDFGCGVGRLSQALASHFDEVVGVDIAPSMIKLAKQYNRHGRRCRYYLNEVDDLRSFDSANFDLVYSNLVLQHMEPRYAKRYIQEFLRILVPGGSVVFQLPGERLVAARDVDPIPGSVVSETAQRGPLLRRVVKRVAPDSWLEAYRRFRDRNEPAFMEVYTTRREEVESFLMQNGAQIVDVEQNGSAGPGFSSFRYFATKPAQG